jgi:hypothetical protein
MIAQLTTNPSISAERARLVIEQREHFMREKARREAHEARMAQYRDELEKHWSAQFKASAEKIASDNRIPVEKAELILAQITAGEIPNFKASFYDEL